MSLAELQPEESSVIPALLTALERWTSDFPDEVRAGAETDLSLYDRRRTAAAFGSCLSSICWLRRIRGSRRRPCGRRKPSSSIQPDFPGFRNSFTPCLQTAR